MTKRWVIVAVTCLLMATACGARVDPLLQGGNAVQAGNQQTADDTATTVAADTSGDQSSTATTTAGNQASNPTPGAVAPTTGAEFKYDAASEAAACAGGAGNTASDVGVTPTEIAVGNVTGLTGVITNSFNQAPEAVQALFSDINAHGGICGRKLKLIVQDDGQDPGRNEANIRDLIPKVLAFVGSTGQADRAGVQAMVDAKAPDIGFAINANRGQSKVFWSAAGSTLYEQNGKPYSWNTLESGLKAYNSLPKRLAALAYSIDISKQAAEQFAYRFQQAGVELCYTNYSISPASASLDSDVIQMKRNNCDGAFTTMDVSGNTKLLQAEKRQDFHPLTLVTFSSYTPDQIAVAGADTAAGLQTTLNWIPFNEPHPVMQLYLDQLKRYQPGRKPSSFGLVAWAGAQMFVQGLIKNRNPTRANLVKFFESLENYNTGGILTPVTPRLRRPVGPCIIQVEVKNGDFVRKWPPTGFYCSAKLVPSKG